MKTPLLLDGPMGSLLTERGVFTSGAGWSAHAIGSAPAEVRSIHRSYVEAGAVLHRTNTFRTRLSDMGPTFADLARRAVLLAREAVGAHHLLGVLGPIGDCYDPTLKVTEAEAQRQHRELAEVLVSSGVDELLCETFPNPREAELAVEASVGFGVPVSVSLTAGPSGELMTPRALAEAALRCARLGARVASVNCVAIDRVLPYAHALSRTGVPFGVYGNVASWNGPKADASSYAEEARALLDLHPTWLGVCCGGGPLHVERLAALIASSSSP
ncbi:MAG: homocysteine S-methyltransferase family protein [Polyangiaceae bacterium]